MCQNRFSLLGMFSSWRKEIFLLFSLSLSLSLYISRTYTAALSKTQQNRCTNKNKTVDSQFCSMDWQKKKARKNRDNRKESSSLQLKMAFWIVFIHTQTHTNKQREQATNIHLSIPVLKTSWWGVCLNYCTVYILSRQQKQTKQDAHQSEGKQATTHTTPQHTPPITFEKLAQLLLLLFCVWVLVWVCLGVSNISFF